MTHALCARSSSSLALEHHPAPGVPIGAGHAQPLRGPAVRAAAVDEYQAGRSAGRRRSRRESPAAAKPDTCGGPRPRRTARPASTPPPSWRHGPPSQSRRRTTRRQPAAAPAAGSPRPRAKARRSGVVASSTSTRSVRATAIGLHAGVESSDSSERPQRRETKRRARRVPPAAAPDADRPATSRGNRHRRRAGGTARPHRHLRRRTPATPLAGGVEAVADSRRLAHPGRSHWRATAERTEPARPAEDAACARQLRDGHRHHGTPRRVQRDDGGDPGGLESHRPRPARVLPRAHRSCLGSPAAAGWRLRRVPGRSAHPLAADRPAPTAPAATMRTSPRACCTTSATRSPPSTTRTSPPRS